EPRRAAVLEIPPDERLIENIPPYYQVTKPREHFCECLGILVEQATGHPQNRHPLNKQRFPEFLRIQNHTLRHDKHPCPVEQCAPYFKSRRVEGRVAIVREAVVCADYRIAVVDCKSEHSAVWNPYSLRYSRRTRRIHDIRGCKLPLPRHLQVPSGEP